MQWNDRKKSALLGAVAGLVNGLFGAGAGMVLAPTLGKWTDIGQDRLFPTVLVTVVPCCLVSLLVYGWKGDLPWEAAWPYLVGSFLGGLGASRLAGKVPVQWLHRVMGAVLLFGAVRALL